MRRTRFRVWGIAAMVAVALCASPLAVGQAITVDFDPYLTVLTPFSGSVGPDQDRNNDGIPNGDELALISAILADESLPIHEAVRDAYVTNRDRIASDLQVAVDEGILQAGFNLSDTEAQAVVDALSTVGGGWMIWGNIGEGEANARFQTFYYNGSDGAYDSVYAAISGTAAVDVWTDALAEFIMLPDIVAQTGDANGDGTTNLEHYQAASDRAEYLAMALAFDEPEPEPLIIDFDAALTLLANIDSTLAPDQDRNQDGIPNGDELALIAAILADPSLPIHQQVYDAFMANHAILDADLNLPAVIDAYGQDLVDAVINVGAAWMMWNSFGEGEANALLRTVFFNSSRDGVYNLVYDDAVGEEQADAIWEAALSQFVMLSGIVSQTGDANGDGTTNLDHYLATGDRSGYLNSALNFDENGDDPPPPPPVPVEGLPVGGPLGLGLLGLALVGGAAYIIRRK